MSEPGDGIVFFHRIPIALRPRRYRRFALRLQEELSKGRPFFCLITTDAHLRRLNLRFLGKDYATDVLSFPSASPDCLGDLAISLTRARAQAKAYGHPVEREVEILMLHGVLHLLGMDHQSDGGRMARAEKRWRARLGLPAGLIERAAAC